MELQTDHRGTDIPKPFLQKSLNFLKEALICISENPDDQDSIFAFLADRQEELNETLLQFIQNELPSNPQPTDRTPAWNAWELWYFGYWLEKFPLGIRWINVELAIAAYQVSLRTYSQQASSQGWAALQNNLATAYQKRIRGDRADNIEQAINSCQLALQVYTQKAFPQDWAITQGNIARAFYGRFQLNNDPTELNKAVSLVQSALEVETLGSYYFINDQYFLGDILTRRYKESQIPNDLEQAIQAYKMAYNSLSPEHYNRHNFWQAIPQTQAVLGNRLVKDGRWQEGLQLLLNSLEQLSQEGDPQAHAHALLQTGQAYELLTDWDNARLYYRDALRLFDHLQDQPGIAKSRAGLGGVLVSQGHLEKGMTELAVARDIYDQLNQAEDVAAVEQVYQAAQRALQQQNEVFV